MESILFISESGPFPANDGKKQRTLGLLSALASKYHVDFLIINHRIDYEQAVLHNPYVEVDFYLLVSKSSTFIEWRKKVGYIFQYDKSLKKSVFEFCRDKSYVFAFSRYLKPIRLAPSYLRKVADIDDEFNELYNSRIKQANSSWERFRFQQIKWLNQKPYLKLLSQLEISVVVKKEQIKGPQLILQNLPFQSLISDNNQFNTVSENHILFVGKLSYAPNALGLTWFLNSVFPLLLKTMPDLVLTVVSRDFPKDNRLLSLMERQNIAVYYNVAKVSASYKKASLVIAPIFQGAGSNLKIAEAMYHGRPVVSTSFGSKGFESEVEQGFLFLQDSPQSFSDKIVGILTQKVALINLQNRIHSWTQANYSFESWSQRLLNAL